MSGFTIIYLSHKINHETFATAIFRVPDLYYPSVLLIVFHLTLVINGGNAHDRARPLVQLSSDMEQQEEGGWKPIFHCRLGSLARNTFRLFTFYYSPLFLLLLSL